MPIQHMKKIFSALQKKVIRFQKRLIRTEKETKKLEGEVDLPHESRIEKVIVEFSIWSVVKVVFVVAVSLLLITFLGRITSILLTLFVSGFLAITLNPGVDRMARWRIPRGIGCVFLMFLVLSVFLGVLGGIVPIIGGEVARMWAGIIEFAGKLKTQDFSSFPGWFQSILEGVIPVVDNALQSVNPDEIQSTITNFLTNNLEGYLDRVTSLAGKGLSLIAAIFGGIFQFFLVLILTFFLVVEKGTISTFFVQLFPVRYENYILNKAAAVHKKISDWVHGQILLFFIIGLIAYVGLTIIGVKYAVTLALIAGLAEFFPYVGPIIAFTSAAPVAFNESFAVGIATLCLYAGIQFVEGNIIMPLVMKKAVGLSPIVTLVSMLIGWEFLGILGMILAVPIASVAAIFIEEYSSRDREEIERRNKKILKSKKLNL